MKIKLFAFSALALLALAGCNKAEPTVVDEKAAKTQPGADTPPAAPTAASLDAQNAEKAGK
jgi:hypothetical protein